MATRRDSNFDSYELTDKEKLSAACLTHLNKLFIKNLINEELIRRINLEVDVKNVEKFIQEEAVCKATIVAYTYLLDASEAAEKEINRPNPGV